ncbi:uncharacterized protein LOC144447586 [Glandiceps talaboti]
MMITYCGGDHTTFYCPGYDDNANKTECCEDMSGCCYPWQLLASSHSRLFDDFDEFEDQHWFDQVANMLVVGFGILFLIVITCFCIRSCRDSDYGEEEDDFAASYGSGQIIRSPHEAAINTVAIPTDENNRTSFNVIRAYEGHPMMPTSPPGYNDPSAQPPKYEQSQYSPHHYPFQRGPGDVSHTTPLIHSDHGQWYTRGVYEQPSAPPDPSRTNAPPPPYPLR